MYKVMVVDDEPLILAGFDDLVPWEEYGLELAAKAENGNEALALLEKSDIDILITDIKMPGLDGLGLLKALRAAGKTTKALVLSGYDDFAFVKQAARHGIENYLLKPVEEEELAETLLSLVEKLDYERHNHLQNRLSLELLRENILYRWLTGGIGQAELADRAAFLGLDVQAAAYTVCVARLPKGETEPANAAARQTLREGLTAAAPPGVHAESTTAHGDLILLYSASQAPLPQQELAEGLNALAEDMGQRAFLSLSGQRQGGAGAAQAFAEAMRLQDHRLIQPESNFVWGGQALGGPAPFAGPDPVPGFARALQAGRPEEAVAILRETYANMQSHRPPPEYVRQTTFAFVVELSRAGRHRAGVTGPPLEELFASLFRETDPAGIAARLERGLLALQSPPEVNEAENPLVASVLAYLAAHYHEPLALKTLAQKYRVNAAYLGQQFKQATGMLFSQYLCELRINKARQLLCDTELKSSEVARRVGFANTNYFSNTFKKAVGCYPTEYRSRALSENG